MLAYPNKSFTYEDFSLKQTMERIKSKVKLIINRKKWYESSKKKKNQILKRINYQAKQDQTKEGMGASYPCIPTIKGANSQA